VAFVLVRPKHYGVKKMGDEARVRNVTMGTRLGCILPCAMIVLLTLLVPGLLSACSRGTAPAPGPSTIPSALPQSLPFNLHATPEAALMFEPSDRLAAPPMSDPATQAELGHYVYYMSCMVCHGDQGQGLTEEWRSVLDPADQNCWQSKCHAANHPPEGFQIPRKSPPVMGNGALGAFKTAADLFEYMRVEMPWSFPGLFADEEYWQLTAYLARANQVDFQEPIGPHNAANILLVPQLVQTHKESVGFERVMSIVVVALLLGAAISHRWIRAG
jgi:cytochrome c5